MAIKNPTYHHPYNMGHPEDWNGTVDFHNSTDSVYIYTDEGGDGLIGGSADDSLHDGGSGSYYRDHAQDTLNGRGGNDRLDGGSGCDRLCGGERDDTFAFTKGEISNNYWPKETETAYFSRAEQQFDHIIDFTGAGQHGGDMIRFEGFSENATLSFDHVAANRTDIAIYTVTDGDYSAQLMIQFADDFNPTTQQLVKGDYAFYA